MLWTRHFPSTALLTVMMQSKGSLFYLPNNIIYPNLQSLYSVIVSHNCCPLPIVQFICSSFYFFYGLGLSPYAKLVAPCNGEHTAASKYDLILWTFGLHTE